MSGDDEGESILMEVVIPNILCLLSFIFYFSGISFFLFLGT
jgi:hypothetical protein